MPEDVKEENRGVCSRALDWASEKHKIKIEKISKKRIQKYRNKKCFRK
jgi:hypothetical protein